ncbi:MAG: rod shape-determining protein RodA [Marinagarivorans sp.]|nr:rod shape-determining protein RodA [Marinagarivorans sp.]
MHGGKDFVRHMPDSSKVFKKGESLLRTLHIDLWLLLALLTFMLAGMGVLYSASGTSLFMVERQLAFFAIAFCAMLTIAQVPLHWLERSGVWFYLIGVVLLILVLLIGVGAKGAQRWLSLGFIRFQPSEILKLAMPLCIAAYLGRRALPPKFKHVIGCLVIIIIPAVLIVEQPDLGTSILVAASGLICLFLSGLRWRYILGSMLLLGAASLPMWHFVMHDYQKQRVLTLLDPEADKLGSGWNIIQSKTAIGSGGMEGKGWRKGTQSQLDFLPESHTDFIVAVLAEELGFKGIVLLLIGYLFIITRGLIIALKAQTHFGRLLAGSVTLTFFVYVFVNMGMVSGILPIVGVPLPLVSLGGTSLVTLMAGFGLLMAVATESKTTHL